jgi:WG containing repeat
MSAYIPVELQRQIRSRFADCCAYCLTAENTKGKLVIKPQFDAAWSFYEDLAAVKIGEKWGYIDRTGKLVIRGCLKSPLVGSKMF